MIECKFCGYKNSDGSVYCGCCGKGLTYEKRKEDDIKYINDDSWKYYSFKSGIFKNAGPKLKTLAIIFFVISLIVGEVIAISLIISGSNSYYSGELSIIIGIILVIISPLIAWLSSIILYAFGELCEDVHRMRIMNESK